MTVNFRYAQEKIKLQRTRLQLIKDVSKEGGGGLSTNQEFRDAGAEEWGGTAVRGDFERDYEEREELTIERIQEMLEKRQFKELKDELENNMYPVDLADILEDVNEKQLVLIFRLLVKEEAAETFSYMNSDLREVLIGALTDSELEEVMEEMYLDDTVDVLEEMPANVVDRLLMVTNEEKRMQINQLLQYPEDSAGSVMNVDYIALNKEMTVEDAILKIRQVGLNRETIYTCYVTENRKLIGMVSVKDLLMAEDSMQIEDIMETNVIHVDTHEDREEVAKVFNKYDFLAIPVVDREERLVGIVTFDDAMDVMQEEHTEDMAKMAAIMPTDDSYFNTSAFSHAKSRISWLLFLMLSATVSGSIITHYQETFKLYPLLVSFIPMLTGTGGNCGSQSSTLMIRGLALDEIKFKDIFKVIFKEFRIALLVSVVLALVNGLRIYIQYGDLQIAIVIGLALVIIVILSKFIGCTLPLAAEHIGLDPALMAAPLISTIVDICSILIYFQIATVLLHISA